MITSAEVRDRLVTKLRRDLFGPHPDLDPDLAREVLTEKPSRWYVGGFIVPAYDGTRPKANDAEEAAEQAGDQLLGNETLDSAIEIEADDQEAPEQPPKDRFLPSSIGLTVVLLEAVREIGLRVTWGDYKIEPPLPNVLLLPEARESGERQPDRPQGLHWVRIPGEALLNLKSTENIFGRALPGSAAPQRPGGGLEVALHQRLLEQTTPGGEVENLRVVTVFVVNRRLRARAPYTDVCYAFQPRIQLSCQSGFHPRRDLSTYASDDPDLRLGDVHYRDVCEYAVGRNTSGGWQERLGEHGETLPVTQVWTDPMPMQEVEKVAPSNIPDVEFGMEALANIAKEGPGRIGTALDDLPSQYADWRRDQENLLAGLAPRRRETAEILLGNMDQARTRIETGIALLKSDPLAREAFAIMNEAIAMSNRQREAVLGQITPGNVLAPKWRPFQLAFILLNLVGLTHKESPEREIVDLLFFPTGGGKTEAYFGLAAYAIALRRLGASEVLGAGVSVIMRYTLRLLTLDQLSRAAGLVCALELIRTRDADGKRKLGDWPIEIGLWVGGAASPNRMKPKSQSSDPTAATTWLNRYKKDPSRAKSPVPLKACPWCGTDFTPDSFRIAPNKALAQNLAIKCENAECDFTRDRDLPILVVDDPIYRRLPAFLIATVDKFASLPWEGRSGAFFGYVDRFDPENLGRGVRTRTGETDERSVDVALATNMISVGLDISRLGLMVVQGQPKMAAEYIQATSRVGRVSSKPGLVITLLNLHKPRDRTHYEQFRGFHSSFYRAVEATSVTPFAPRALDRALAALVVAAVRHLEPDLTPSAAATHLRDYTYVRQVVFDMIRKRAEAADVDQLTTQRAVERAEELLDAWNQVVAEQTAGGSVFGYDAGSPERRLLQYPLDPGTENLSEQHQRFSAARSMRDVEYGVFLKVRDPRGNVIHGAKDIQ